MQTQHHTDHTSNSVPNQSKILGHVVLEPRKMSKLVVDIANQPTLNTPQVEIQPNKPEIVGVSLEELHDDKATTFIYHFQNFSDTVCHITVKAARGSSNI